MFAACFPLSSEQFSLADYLVIIPATADLDASPSCCLFYICVNQVLWDVYIFILEGAQHFAIHRFLCVVDARTLSQRNYQKIGMGMVLHKSRSLNFLSVSILLPSAVSITISCVCPYICRGLCYLEYILM